MKEYKKLKHKPSILSDFTPEGLVVMGLMVLGAVIVVILIVWVVMGVL